MGDRMNDALKSNLNRNRVSVFFVFSFLLFALCSLLSAAIADAERIKDIASFSGIRDNELIGYGLVAGLKGTGDSDGTYYYQPVANMLNRMGININPADVKGKTKNIAAVIVTAKLPTMLKPGSKIDVQVSSIGDCKSLQGGTLFATELRGFDNNVYAVAQGPLSVGGISSGGAGHGFQNHITAGSVPEGAIVEREVPVQLNRKSRVDILLNAPDFSTSTRVANKINEQLGGIYAKSEGPSVVSLIVPDAFRDKVVDLISTVEMINVSIDTPARVVINERTGTVVIGENVSISPVALAQGSLTIEIKAPAGAAAPAGGAAAGAAAAKRASVALVNGASIGELVNALNTLGVTPKDLIGILQAIKAAGSLNADLVIM